MKKYKKPLLIALVALDVALIAFFLVLSIMILVTVTKYKNEAVANSSGLIKAILQMKPVASFFAFVLPMFLVLAGNIVGLMLYRCCPDTPGKESDPDLSSACGR